MKVVRKSLAEKELSAFLSGTRVRNRMKTKRMKEAADFADGRGSRRGCRYGWANRVEPYSIIPWITIV